MDAAQLVFGCAVLPAVFRAVGHARVQRASHEPAANVGRSFIEEASAADKALFVLKMLGTHRPIGWRREWSRLARHLADEAAKRSVMAEKAPSQSGCVATRQTVEDSTFLEHQAAHDEVIFLGDLLFHEALGRSSLSERLRRRLARAKVLVVNLEGTIGDSGRELYPFQSLRGLRQLVRWNATKDAQGWVSRFEADRLRSLLEGLPPTVFTLGNNHSLDDGPEGLARTVAAIEALGARHVGADCNDGASRIIDVGLARMGIVSIGFGQNHAPAAPGVGAGLTFATVPYRLPRSDLERHSHRLRRLGATHLIAALHWGYEHEHAPRADQVDCVLDLWDLGFTTVIGHHPHIVQPSFGHGPHWVSFSLGDFVGGDRTIFNRFSHAVSVRFPSGGRAPQVETIALAQSPYHAERHVTCLLEETDPLEQFVWRALFEAKLPR
jgi:hypothetical protein